MKQTPSLAELQERFFDSVMLEDDVHEDDSHKNDSHKNDSISGWVVDNGLPAMQRMQIYRHIIENILSEALETSYPAIHALVGADFFALAAGRYMRRYPPKTGNLQDYGAQFPVFLADMKEAETLPYLADVAGLEWARQQCYLAADVRSLAEFEVICQLQAVGDAPIRLTLHPSVQFVDSAHRIFDIWRYCMRSDSERSDSVRSDSERLQLEGEGQPVCLWRDGTQVAMQVLDAPAGLFLQTIREGMDVQHALDRVHDEHGDYFKFDDFFNFMVRNNMIVNVRKAEESL